LKKQTVRITEVNISFYEWQISKKSYNRLIICVYVCGVQIPRT
jgi:hypothetical protein